MIAYDSICCFRSREDSVMRRVCWEITTACNLNCEFCHRYGLDSHFYDYSSLSETIKILRNNNIENVIISGGEPLLHPNIMDIIEKLQNEGFDLDLCSNGVLIDLSMANRLKQYLSEISISIDGYSKLRHEEMRNSDGCFQKTKENTSLLVSMGFDVHVTTVVDVAFSGEIVKMTDFLRGIGVSSVSYIGLIPIDKGINPLFKESVQSKLNEQLAFVRNAFQDITVNTKQLLINNTNNKCGAGDVVWGLGVDGLELHPCLLTRKRNKINTHDDFCGLCPGSSYLTKK